MKKKIKLKNMKDTNLQLSQRRQSSQLGGNRTGEGIVLELPAEESMGMMMSV